MGTWWLGTSLVAERGLVESLRSRSFKVVTGVLLLLSIAAVTVPQILGAQATTYTIATAGKAPADVAAGLNAAGRSADFTVRYISRSSPRPGQTAPSRSWSPRPSSRWRPPGT